MLNFSSFMHLVYDCRNKQNYDLSVFLTDAFENLMEGNPVGNIYERPYLSNLYNGVRELTKEIIDAFGLGKTAQMRTYNGICNWLIPELSPLLMLDFKSKLITLINNDESISQAKKADFNNLYESDELAVFLKGVFLYAIKKPNVTATETPPKDEIEYLVETNRTCALCGNVVYKTTKKKTLYNYVVADIYPSILADDLVDAFDEIKPKPVDPEAKQNKICLCPTCATHYSLSPTIVEYKKLVEKKKVLLKKNGIKEKIDVISLDEEIDDVLKKLKNIRMTPKIQELRKIPLEINEKIQNNDILRDRILDDVNRYYYFVRDALIQIDGKAIEFQIIANSFQNCYFKLKQEELEQEEIYNKITNWMLDKLELSDNYRTACQIIVSFFVQNCEVFDAITQ